MKESEKHKAMESAAGDHLDANEIIVGRLQEGLFCWAPAAFVSPERAVCTR